MSLPSAEFGEHSGYSTISVDGQATLDVRSVSPDRSPKLIEAFSEVYSEATALSPESSRC